MHVRSKLADIDFEFGYFEYKKDHLIIHSHPDQAMQSRVYVSPNDIVSALGKILVKPRIWLYFLCFPYHLVKYRRRKKARENARAGGDR